MKSKNIVLGLGILTFGVLSSGSGCKQEEPINEPLLKTAEELGWQTKNLDVATFRNGDPIPEAKTTEEWEAAADNKTPAWCYYENDLANGEKYGKLYNWYAVNDSRGLAPQGYHIATKAEWDQLISDLGGEAVAGKKLKSTEGWFNNGVGTNEIGFSSLPGGLRYSNGDFSDGDYDAFFWSATGQDSNLAFGLDQDYRNDFINIDLYVKGQGYSVRCKKD